MAHLSIHGCTCCVPASVVSKVADKQRAVECRELGASSASSAFRYNAYRPCAPRMAHLSIHGCTCCVPASVVSKVADKQSTAKYWEPAAQVRPFGRSEERRVGKECVTRSTRYD